MTEGDPVKCFFKYRSVLSTNFLLYQMSTMQSDLELTD